MAHVLGHALVPTRYSAYFLDDVPSALIVNVTCTIGPSILLSSRLPNIAELSFAAIVCEWMKSKVSPVLPTASLRLFPHSCWVLLPLGNGCHDVSKWK